MAPSSAGKWQCIALSLLLAVIARRADSTCPRTCFCNPVNKNVHCARRGLAEIPDLTPAGSLEINLNGNVFASSTLRRANFSRFTALEHLYLNECGIESVHVGTFADLPNLKRLDLSNNRIGALQAHTFRGLRLDHLFLNGNRHIRFVPASFAGLSTTGLYLHDCALSQITAAVLRPLNRSLRTLVLDGNELTRLERPLLDVFSTLQHLRLGNNPLHCSCEVTWLKAFYDARRETLFQGAKPPPGCWTPLNMRGRLFDEIRPSELHCQPPVFNNIDARLGGDIGRLRCTASGDPAPTLYWIQPTGSIKRYSPPKDDDVHLTEGVLTIKALPAISNRKNADPAAGMYICVAHNEAGNVTLTLNVSWPQPPRPAPATPPAATTPTVAMTTTLKTRTVTTPDVRVAARTTMKSSQTPLVVMTNAGGAGGKSRGVVKAREMGGHNYTSSRAMLELCRRRQSVRVFNLTELIGAIVGTHVCTLLLCLVFMPVYYKRRWRRHRRDSLEKAPHPDETRYLNELRHYVETNGLKR